MAMAHLWSCQSMLLGMVVCCRKLWCYLWICLLTPLTQPGPVIPQGKRYSLPNSRIMIHQPLGGAQGQATDIEIQANEILHHKLTLNGYLVSSCALVHCQHAARRTAQQHSAVSLFILTMTCMLLPIHCLALKGCAPVAWIRTLSPVEVVGHLPQAHSRQSVATQLTPVLVLCRAGSVHWPVNGDHHPRHRQGLLHVPPGGDRVWPDRCHHRQANGSATARAGALCCMSSMSTVC